MPVFTEVQFRIGTAQVSLDVGQRMECALGITGERARQPDVAQLQHHVGQGDDIL